MSGSWLGHPPAIWATFPELVPVVVAAAQAVMATGVLTSTAPRFDIC